jgi:HSP20 family protein
MHPDIRDASSGLLFALRDELERWLGAVRGGNGTWAPAMDMYEDDGELYIEMELPGVSVGDVEILASGQEIIIRAPVASPPPPAKSLVMERRRGSYERRLALDSQWDAGKTRAEFQDGLLTLRLPQVPQMEGTKRIRLEAAKPASRTVVTGAEPPKEKAAAAPQSTPEPDKSAAPGNGTGTGSGPLLIGGPINESKS